MDFPIVQGVEFRAIEGFPGYAVGDDGSVWSSRIQGDRSNRVGPWKRMKPSVDKEGYLQCGFRRGDGKKWPYKVHRLVLQLFVGPCPKGLEACHDNGINCDNRLENLRWDTHKSNVADRERHGTILRGDKHPNRIRPEKLARGECHPRAKLTEEKVREIRRRCAAGESQRMIAAEFCLYQTAISNIVTFKRWKHVSA